jgi:hypothetical protein
MSALAIVLLCGGAAAAQPVASPLDALKVLQSTDSRVIVTDTKGQEFRGTVADVSPTQLSLRMGRATRQFTAAEVRSVRVRREDSLANGALIGLAVGGGLASLVFLDNECHDDPDCYAIVAVDAGIGALVGLGIDALIHRHVVVYAAPASGGRPAVTASPLLGRARAGVRVTIGF